MSLNVNFVMIAGNVTRPVELRYTPQGKAVCDFGVAVNERWTDKATGEKKEEANFIECTAWGATAERAAEFLKKGVGVLVEGKLRQERWETPEGKKQSKTKVTVNHWQFTTPKKETTEPTVVIPDEQGQDDGIPF